MEDRSIAQVVGQPTRLCRACGAKAAGRSCPECGASVGPRQKIGVLNGVGQNFGTVNNVYNFGGETEVVDFRDIQDGLNERFPERIPPRPDVAQEVNLLPPPRTPSGLVRTVNIMSYVWLGVVVVSMAGALYAVWTYGR